MNAKLAAVAFAAMIAAMSFPASAQSISYYQTGEEFAGPFPSWKSVKEFGAKGDGSTDDAAAIGKALKALKNTNAKTWNVLYFPAGTYMIGQPVYYTDRVNEDYTGLRIVGEDPATTLIKCMDTFPVATGGVAQGAMVRLDGTYGNICRISFDGNHRASIGLLRDGVYGTDWRITDMFFSNLATGIQYGGSSDQGQDLTAIMRCRFSRCGTGLKMTNQNCMGIYAWYCLFEDCRTAIDNGGGFAMPMCNVFLRSAVVDITTGQNGYPVLNNTSVGSKMFLDNSQSPWCMVMANNNKVYNATDATVMKNVDVALDNTILSRSGSRAGIQLRQAELRMRREYVYDPEPGASVPHEAAFWNRRSSMPRRLPYHPPSAFQVRRGTTTERSSRSKRTPATLRRKSKAR